MRGLLAGAIVSVLFALVPPAGAQWPAPAVEVDIQPFSGRLMPETGTAVVRIVVRVGCNGMELFATQMTATIARLPSYASLIVSPMTSQGAQQAPDCVPGRGTTFHLNATVRTNRDAPAFEDGVYQLNITIVKGPYRYGPYPAKFVIKNDYAARISVHPATTRAHADPGNTAEFVAAVINYANGPTRVNVSLLTGAGPAPSEPRGETDLRLPSPIAGGQDERRTLTTITARVPSTASSGQSFAFVARFNGTFDGTASGTIEHDLVDVSYSVTAWGFFAPAAGPAAMAVALGVGAWLRRP